MERFSKSPSSRQTKSIKSDSSRNIQSNSLKVPTSKINQSEKMFSTVASIKSSKRELMLRSASKNLRTFSMQQLQESLYQNKGMASLRSSTNTLVNKSHESARFLSKLIKKTEESLFHMATRSIAVTRNLKYYA